jgi:HlyD family secretion protein
MKKSLLFVFLIIVIVAGSFGWWRLADHESPEGLVLYGNVDTREVRLAFNNSEHVEEMFVDEGDWVHAGQLVARLHTNRLQAALDSARAKLTAAEAEARIAQLTYRRIKSLAARKLAAPEDADEAEGKSRAATAQVDAAKAALAERTEAFNDAELRSPVEGIVRERIVEAGDFVTPQTPVLTVALVNPVWIRAYIPETWLGRVKPGTEAQISTDSFPGKVYKGWVGSISPTAEFTPKNVETTELRTRLVYQVRVFSCNPDNELRLGMPATVTLDLDTLVEPVNDPERRCRQGTESG